MTNITSTSLSSKRLSLVVCLRLPPLINRLFIPFSLSLFSPSKNSTCDLAQYIGSLLTGVRKSCKGRAVRPKPAHQVTVEAQEVEAVRTTPANSAAAESTAPTMLSPFAGLLANRERVDRPRSRSFFSPPAEISSGACSCWPVVWHQPLVFQPNLRSRESGCGGT